MQYFEKSQKIKLEILKDNNLLNTARSAFDEKIEPFSFGGTVNLYFIGRIPSGKYVALRVFRNNLPEGQESLERQIKLMEYYCQNAEYLDDSLESVPEFCIGAVKGNKAGIFTEDLSNGGSQEIKHCPDNDYALVGPQKRKVFVDIDSCFRAPLNIKIKYFLNKNLIRI